MTKAQALFNYFNTFGLTAYPTNSVPDDTVYPWLTYEPNIGNYGDIVNAAVNVYYHSESEKAINAKVEEIASAIGLGGKVIGYDGGAIWIKRGSPWCNALLEVDGTKRRQLNITLEYL